MNIQFFSMSPAYSVAKQAHTSPSQTEKIQNHTNFNDDVQDTDMIAKTQQSFFDKFINRFDRVEISNEKENGELPKIEKCQTCENRKYQDGSNDPSVSFKTPTAISPDRAAAAVRNHEMEHVFNEQIKAQKEDREVVSQSVAYSTNICPECHRVYISGGETRTVTKSKQDYQVGIENQQKGELLDVVA